MGEILLHILHCLHYYRLADLLTISLVSTIRILCIVHLTRKVDIAVFVCTMYFRCMFTAKTYRHDIFIIRLMKMEFEGDDFSSFLK